LALNALLCQVCRMNPHDGNDPSNWSKLERELIPPPHHQPTLRAWARHLGLKPHTPEWQTFFGYAAIAAGRLLADKALAAQLPALFRALAGHKPSAPAP